jgi:hypothetical protein
MATTTPGITFVSGETVTPAKLNSAATPTISAIQTADISDNQITTAKIVDANVTDAKLATGAVTGAAGGGKIAESAISGQTAITTLDGTDAFLVWDDTDDTLKKITKTDLSTEIVGDASITAAKINGVAKDASGNNLSVGTAPVFGCRAWVNFDGTAGSTVDGEFRCTIRASGNVTKVVRNGTGDYTVTFTTAMPDANYAVMATLEAPLGSLDYPVGVNSSAAPTTTTVRIYCGEQLNNTVSGSNRARIYVAIFR